MPNKSSYIAIDVGGTKTIVAIVTVDYDRDNSLQIAWSKRHATITGCNVFPLFLGKVILQAINAANDMGMHIESTCLIGLPGNFIAGDDFKFKSGSGKQLVLPNESIDDLDVSGWLQQALPSSMTLWGINDAQAQAFGGFIGQWDTSFINRTILYIGSGTGLGGAIMKVGDSMDTCEWITDGHIYDILVSYGSGMTMVEDCFSGRAFVELTGHTAIELSKNKHLFALYKSVIDDSVSAISDMITQIQSRKVIKYAHNNQWSDDDQQLASQVSMVMLGGGIIQGNSLIGKVLIDEIQKKNNIDVVTINRPDEVAIYGVIGCYLKHT